MAILLRILSVLGFGLVSVLPWLWGVPFFLGLALFDVAGAVVEC